MMDDLTVDCCECPSDTLKLVDHDSELELEVSLQETSATVYLADEEVKKVYQYLGTWLKHRKEA
jgi:hypothetical protein